VPRTEVIKALKEGGDVWTQLSAAHAAHPNPDRLEGILRESMSEYAIGLTPKAVAKTLKTAGPNVSAAVKDAYRTAANKAYESELITQIRRDLHWHADHGMEYKGPRTVDEAKLVFESGRPRNRAEQFVERSA
jgi:hypothetical protein